MPAISFPDLEIPAKEDRLDRRGAVALALILIVGTVVRFHELGRPCFWYDEVVTMRLAERPGPTELVELLNRIDATRAPLHPLLLQGWIKALGDNEASGRAFSAICGILTVLSIFRLGQTIFRFEASGGCEPPVLSNPKAKSEDRGLTPPDHLKCLQGFCFRDTNIGLYSAYLATISPLLIVYSREARMYAWLVLITCLAWSLFFQLVRTKKTTPFAILGLYALSLVALVYSHPLGLLMVATLGLASILAWKTSGVSTKSWLAAYAAAGLCVAPWIGHYLDHPPESMVGRLPVRFLLGTPIGFLGGDFRTLVGFAALIAFGLIRLSGEKPRLRWDAPLTSRLLVLWLIVPPLVLYAYSWVSHPIFGPARYTLYVAPAYLLLVGRGLARLPFIVRMITAFGILLLASWLGSTLIFGNDLKADWRAAARFLKEIDPNEDEAVAVIANEGGPNVEVETARYYFKEKRLIVPFENGGKGLEPGKSWVAVGLRDGVEIGKVPKDVGTSDIFANFEGLRLRRTKSPSAFAK